MNRKYILGVILAVIVLSSGGLWYGYFYLPSVQSKSIIIAAPMSVNLGYWEFPYAQYAGIYKRYNLNVTFVQVGSATDMIAAVIAGQAQAAIGVGDTIRAQLSGATQLKIIIVLAGASFGLMVQPGIKTINDVKTVAQTSGRGSDGDVLMREYLLHHGLTPDKDVTSLFISRDALLPGFQNHLFDSCTAGSNSYDFFKLGANQLLKFADEFPQWCTEGLSVTDSMIKQRPEDLKNLLKALYESQTYIMNHRQEAIDYAVNTLKLTQENAIFIYDYAYSNKYGSGYHFTPSISVANLNYTMTIGAKYSGMQPKPISQLVDTSLWDQARKELGI